jgi:hypothetical protein
MRTYQVAAPVASHYRPATCAEVDCDAYLNGWVTKLDETDPDGQMMAGMLRRACRPTSAPAEPGIRRYIETRDPAGLTLFEFPAGQPCFRAEPDSEARHVVPLDRPELYIVRGGDWRRHLGVERVHTGADSWLDDFAENQSRLSARLEGG